MYDVESNGWMLYECTYRLNRMNVELVEKNFSFFILIQHQREHNIRHSDLILK